MNYLRIFLCLTTVTLFSLSVSASGNTGFQEIPLLELNTSIERNIAEGETHSYRIRLHAGDFAHISCEGKDSTGKALDGTSKVIAPDGQQVFQVGKLSGGPFGVHPISLVAETAGDYLLTIRPLEKSGTYKIVLDALRPATLQDRSRARAEAAFIKADALLQTGKKENLQQAAEILRASLADWRTAEIPYGEADALNLLGITHRRLGETNQAIERYQQAFDVFQRQNWPIGKALMLNNIGVAYSEAGDKATALQYYRHVTEIWREWNTSIMYGISMTNLGSLYGSVGEFRKGIETLNEALAIWEGRDDRKWKYSALNKLAVIYEDLGESEIALEYCQQALQFWRESDGVAEKAQPLMCVGSAQATAGNYPKAIEYQTEAIKICQESGNTPCQITAITGLGLMYAAAQDYRRSIEYLQQALEIARATKNTYSEAKLLGNLGRVYIKLNDLPTAERLLLQSLELQQSVGDSQGEAFSHLGLADLYRRKGYLNDALASAQKALAIVEQQRQALSGHPTQATYFSRLHEYQEFYLDLLMQLHRKSPAAGYAVTAFQASEQARARALIEAMNESRSDIREGVDAELFERETALRQQLYYKEQALAVLLSGKRNAEKVEAAKKEIEALLVQKREVESLIRSRNPRYAALMLPELLSLPEIQKQVLDDDTVLLEYALGEERSFLFAVTKTSFDVYELPKRADIEAVAKQFYRLTARRPPEFTVAKEWLAKAEREYPAIAAKLSQMILKPAAAQLGKKRLLIVAEGALQYVPFSALPAPSAQGRIPLAVSHEINSLPSASLLAVLRREASQRQAAPKSLAVLGDPVFSKTDERFATGKPSQPTSARNFPADLASLRRDLRRGANNAAESLQVDRLRYTRQEALAIASMVTDDSKLVALDFDASRELATNAKLSQYRIVHFATHGWLDTAMPDLSAVLLSLVDKDGKPQNGFLRLHEIYNLNLPAELVVLSACETGLGKDVKGEGLISLTRGFMYAGARRVLVSLWPVDDPATAELMKRFYRGMLKENLSPAKALRQAQREMLKTRWRSPYYWAGFVLQGEW